jgi:hypothetical protein
MIWKDEASEELAQWLQNDRHLDICNYWDKPKGIVADLVPTVTFSPSLGYFVTLTL